MQWFSALIPAYPHIQQKAHEELDRVVGRDRLPTIDDEKNLPYIHAIIKVSTIGSYLILFLDRYANLTTISLYLLFILFYFLGG